jgi:hypothetical protein
VWGKGCRGRKANVPAQFHATCCMLCEWGCEVRSGYDKLQREGIVLTSTRGPCAPESSASHKGQREERLYDPHGEGYCSSHRKQRICTTVEAIDAGRSVFPDSVPIT